MKNPVESSTISHSQSEANNTTGKNQLVHGTTTKLDSLFRIYDDISNKSYFPNIIYLVAYAYLYFQIFFSSLYPFNKFWYTLNADRSRYTSNSVIIKIFTILEYAAWFFHIEDDKLDSSVKEKNGQTELLIPAILICAVFVFSLFAISSEMLGAFRLHTLRKMSYYTLRLGFTVLSPAMLIPISAFFGIALRNLGLGGSKLNWIYLIVGVITYFIFAAYSYIGLMVLNTSTSITKTALSSFSVKIPLLLGVVCSLSVIFQCIFSLFSHWAMVIVQLSHAVISIIAFKEMIYLVFHSKLANILFIGFTLSSWLNDIIFSVLHFIPPPSSSNDGMTHSSVYFYYTLGLIAPLASLIISITAAFFYVNSKTHRILKELWDLSDQINDTDDTNYILSSTTMNNKIDSSILQDSKLFKNEQTALMSLHISFMYCLPLFYKWTAMNYIISLYQTNTVLIQMVQYLSFFPGASRKLNNFLNLVSQIRNLNYHQRFLLYEIYRIKIMRQSSVSTEANHKLADLKNLSSQAFENVYLFWNSKNANASYLEMIASENFKIDNKWEEAIREYPNFQKFSDEYCSFLVECHMDLELAIVMKHRSNLIEMGRSFHIDVPFRSFAKNFPMYLKKGIINGQGSFKVQKREDLHNSTSNANNSVNSDSKNSAHSSGTGSESGLSSSLSTNFVFDPEIEESIGKQLFNKANLRLEMHRALSNRKSYASKLLLLASLILLVVGFTVFTAIYVSIINYIVDRSDSMYYLNLASKARFYLDLSILGSTLKFAYHTNRFTTLDLFNELRSKDNVDAVYTRYDASSYTGYDPDSFLVDDQISQRVIHRNNMISIDSFEQLLNELSILSQTEVESIYEFAKVLMSKEITFYSCYNGKTNEPQNLTLKELEVYLNYLIDRSAAKDVVEGSWYNSDDICELIANQPAFENTLLQLFQTLMNHEIGLCEAKKKIIKLLSYTLPFIPVLIYIFPPMIFQYLFIKDTNNIVNILLNVNQEAKDEAKKPILKECTIEMIQPAEKRPKSKQWLILKVALIIFTIAAALLLYFMLSETDELNENIKKLGRWNLLASIRMANSIEVVHYSFSAVILNGSKSLNISTERRVANRDMMISLTKASLVKLHNANEALLKGSGDVGPCIGFDEKLDKINTEMDCEISSNSGSNQTDIHDNYKCSSASQGVSILASMIDTILDEMETTGGNFDNIMIPHSLHLLNRHLLKKLEQVVDRINEINIDVCNNLKSKVLITYLFGLLMTILTFVVSLLFYVKSNIIYNAGMFLVQRLPPFTFFSDKHLNSFIMSKKEIKEKTEMTTSESVIFMSHDAIICTNFTGDVEIINPAVTSILGYTPEQMLGQNISTFFSHSSHSEPTENKSADQTSTVSENLLSGDAGRILNQLELMKNGQSGLVYEGHFKSITDNANEMPCGVTVLGMTNRGHTSLNENHVDSNIESFVFILRDETELVSQQREAEKAKAQSENLLFHILPRDIVARLNSGEKDISFTVQSASIIFTDVVKFSEYASCLSPQEIMGSLSTLFAAFDECAKKYDLITKIKLIGDIYMAAGGLFSDDSVQPKTHAEQILNFGIDCLTELDSVNIKLNANLQLRVGINTGGPLLAGVLGTDKPVFDIIGDPINVAARLQTTDIPGKAQIPKSTYDLVCDGDFMIEERGEVFLKGKGKSMAYLVSPIKNTNTNAFIEGSASIPILQ